ncbi:MAG: hypothetical protein E7Z92_06615 [Cyanobacteria bacterium SIG31]|nr:hypothetical protein [Cyanobacteria bacterium SIG31]
MNKLANVGSMSIFESTVDELFILETLIKFTKETCLGYEISSQYYHLPIEEQVKLSKERNHYINMLSVVEEKLNMLIKSCSEV